MKLIADSGSTKTAWVLVKKDGTYTRTNTEGYNPYYLNTPKIVGSLKANLLPHINAGEVSEVYFYGAGVSTPENVKIVKDALSATFASASNIFVGHDLLAACRAVLKKEEGFAAILGTGCNTALYDGEKITLNIDSLGFNLGDEGSGSYISRLLLRSYLRGYLPFELNQAFEQKYGGNKKELLRNVYDDPLPNRYMAGFAPFVGDHKEHAYIRQILVEAFTDFFKDIVSHYPGYKNYTFNCVGSIGFLFQDIVSEVAAGYGMKMGRMIKSPIDDLVKFHLM